MLRSLTIIVILTIAIANFTFFYVPQPSAAQAVKQHYLQLTTILIQEANAFKETVTTSDEKKIQQQFLQLRKAYKKTEVIVEYYFNFYAVKLNGPSIPFFEEDEPDVPVNEPNGMQVIENLIFPHLTQEKKELLHLQTNELVRYANELPTINESFEFNDANIFDALMEEIYRITALGVTGFDSPTANNSLPETAAALESLQEFSAFYQTSFKEKLPGKFELLEKLLKESQLYIDSNKSFNAFNRMYFINTYLNPIASITGAYKKAYALKDNPAGQYYSAIKKNNTLFTAGAFDQYRFLDDFNSTPEKIALGKLLFFEKQLSANNERSCATCHQPEKAFTDGLKTSMALDGHSPLPRNAPTIWNVALQRNLFVDSRSRNLEDQVMQVLNNAKEMHGVAQIVAEKIIALNKYRTIYTTAYPNSNKDDAAQNICNAIACYERTLIALNSRFDQQMNGTPVLTSNEINGFNLFMGKAKCGTCHFMPLFGGAKPPRYYYMESEVLGVPANSDKKNAVLDSDSGRYRVTQSVVHLFAFKTPALRNVALTAPYMHNGVFKTLEEVVDFYNDGGGKGLKIAPQNQSLPFDKLDLSAKEKKDIVAFMKTLTDTAAAY